MACPRADRRRCSRSLPPPRPRGVAIWGRRGRPDAECKRWDRDRLRLGFDQFDGDGDFQASSSSIGGMLSIGSGLTRRLTGGTERSAGAPPRAAWCRKARLDRASPYDVRRHVSTALSPARARDSHGGSSGDEPLSALVHGAHGDPATAKQKDDAPRTRSRILGRSRGCRGRASKLFEGSG